MSENAVAEPLGGSEIIDAIVFRVREALGRDCYLNPNAAYEYFHGKIHIQVTAVDCGRQAPVDITINVTKGDENQLDGGEGYQIEVTEEIDKQAPNVVRRESDQSVPVNVADGAGKVEQKAVKYARQPKPQVEGKGVKTPVAGPGTAPAA